MEESSGEREGENGGDGGEREGRKEGERLEEGAGSEEKGGGHIHKKSKVEIESRAKMGIQTERREEKGQVEKEGAEGRREGRQERVNNLLLQVERRG